MFLSDIRIIRQIINYYIYPYYAKNCAYNVKNNLFREKNYYIIIMT